MNSYFSLTNVVTAAITTCLGTIFFMLLDRKSRSNQENKTTASSSPPPSSSLTQNRKYQVFPSFHGPDVRGTLLSHTLAKFKSKGIDAFIDNNIERSKSIGPELIEAIRGSRIAVVFLSKNYASSTWCLNELVEIIKCRKDLKQIVMVIFHEVDPTDVKKQTGDFGKVFGKTCKGKTMEVIEGWKHALAEVAILAGYHLKRGDNEAKMLEKITTDVSNNLNNSTPSRDFDGLVGMESHMINMGPLLQLDSEEVRIIGILGPPGIGKTTLARFLFDRHSKKFPLRGFMNIRAMSERSTIAGSDVYSVKLSFLEQFMSQLTNDKNIKIPHLGNIEDRLKDQKVLVVLDNVVKLEQLDAMAKETCWFGPCSRIIITTQNEKLLKQGGINLIYKVDLPSPDEALQMFCMYAFGQKYPKDGFMELACEATRLAGELPLGLRVMGSYFRGMSIQDWTKARARLLTRLDRDIESILKFSYDALDDDDQNLFLHIACIFKDERVDIVEGCLANSSSLSDVALGLHVLVERSLITMDWGRITMHNLLVLLGEEIVRKKYVDDPGKRKFLCDARDIYEVLSDDQAGSSSVIGINLREDITCTSERAFERLSNLKFLRIDHGKNINPRTMNYISRKLRLLSWRYFGMSCFPSSFHPKFLVKLDMESSGLEKLWEDTQPLSNLKWVNLSFSESLKELPDLSTATNLYELNLYSCSSLVCLPSIGNAINLHKLDLSDCSSLVKLHPSIGNAINLKSLVFTNCSKLVEIPSSIGKAINLKSLHFYNCSSLVEIPSFIRNAINLDYVNLSYCSSLVKLPSSVGNAYKNFKVFNFNGCSSLVELPNSIRNAVNLEELLLEGCSSLVELPSSIGNAINLHTLDLTGCSSLVKLPFSIGNAINLKYLILIGCSSLVELPSSIINLRKLRVFFLKNCSKLEVVLTNIDLESLEVLDLSGCSLLRSYSETSTEIEDLKPNGTAIKELDPWFGRISYLRHLVLSGMKKMVTLPQLPDSIEWLDAENCESLEILDCSFHNPDIKWLNFSNCFKLNQEAKDLIIQTRTKEYAVLPGGEVPVCFTFRSYGGSLTVNLNEKPPPTSTKFKACIIFADEDDLSGKSYGYVCCSITSKQNALTACISEKKPLKSYFSKHLYIFEVEAVEVTSTELVFEFEIRDWDGEKVREIKKCGIYQLSDKEEEKSVHTTEAKHLRWLIFLFLLGVGYYGLRLVLNTISLHGSLSF